MTTAEEIISILGLKHHPEGGYYREIYRHPAPKGNRGLMTSIYYLIMISDQDKWHRHDAQEIWCHHAGAPAELSYWVEGQPVQKYRIGTNFAAGERPQVHR